MAEKIKYTVRGRTFILTLVEPNEDTIKEYAAALDAKKLEGIRREANSRLKAIPPEPKKPTTNSAAAWGRYVEEKDAWNINKAAVVKYNASVKSNTKLPPDAHEQSLRDARAREKQERAAKAYKTAWANGELAEAELNPQRQKPNGTMSKGDAGISQRTEAEKAREQEICQSFADAINSEIAHRNADRDALGRVDHIIPNPDSGENLLNYLTNAAFVSSGAGLYNNQFAELFSKIDRFERNILPRNSEFSGYTFMTRPRLNLTSANLIADRNFAALNTMAPNTVPFMIRCLLDPQFCKDNYDIATKCALLDYYSPFLTPLNNDAMACTGFVDPVLATETTEGGFFSEDQTYVIGGDRMAKTYDISYQFKDHQGGTNLAILDWWVRYMANITDGTMIQYADAIDANRLDYTVSIYRFITDRSKRFVTKWCKCTGCFPRTAPIGVPFNKNAGEQFITASGEFSVPFVVNHIGYNDPIILKEFNMLVDRYAGNILTDEIYNAKAQNNFHGLPYIIVNRTNGIELVYRKCNLSTESIASARENAKYGRYIGLPSSRENSRLYGLRESQASQTKGHNETNY